MPEPLILDRSVLNLYPLSSGPQHDERRSSIDALPNWLSSLALKFIPESKLLWVEGLRSVPNDAPLHQSVLERFQAEKVLIYGEGVPYRPTNLRQHNEVKQYYSITIRRIGEVRDSALPAYAGASFAGMTG